MMKNLLLFLLLLFLASCDCRDNKRLNDLNTIKKEFLLSIMSSDVIESPFHMSYSLETVFYSSEIMSLLGTVYVFDHLPHGWSKHEGKTFYKVNDKFKELTLRDLFTTAPQLEFIKSYCENALKLDSLSYFSGVEPLRTTLDLDEIRHFVIDDKHLTIIFQPYSVGGLIDCPWNVRITFDELSGHWNPHNPLTKLMPKILASNDYTTSFNQIF